jgi:CDGSH-type Zn-finger protein/uncharacterized Fe-S cluster protein YjdI
MSDARDPGSTPDPPAPPAPGVARGDRVHRFEAEGITVTWSRKRCTHAAECVMNLPTVFEPGRSPWVDATQGAPDAIARVVMRCPTGALHFARTDGGAAEPVPATNTIRVTRNGPIVLRGDIEVLNDAGEVMLRDTRVALCRCGQSRMKPLCDNAHRAAGFRDAGQIVDEDSVQDPGATGGTLRVIPQANGSLQLSGPFAIASDDGEVMLAGTSTWFCRCGQSGTKPFCDGSHERVGFVSG